MRPAVIVAVVLVPLKGGAFAQQDTTASFSPSITNPPATKAATSTSAIVSSTAIPIPQIPNNRTVTIRNNCSIPIWPGLATSEGARPYTHGFGLEPGSVRQLWVGADWVGRVWGRANCKFGPESFSPTVNGSLWDGHCETGRCGSLDCKMSGQPPATLAEFNMAGYQGLTFYDISLVDGYSVDMSITAFALNKTLHPTAKYSPSCVALPSLLSPTKKTSRAAGGRWCPSDLMLYPLRPLLPPRPGHPEDGIGRKPAFFLPDDHLEGGEIGNLSPCYSACAKYGKDKDCCTGKHGEPGTCKPNFWASEAKRVCPDAYSYAYDDVQSTFTLPTGADFEITFCPTGASTSLMKNGFGQA